MHRAKPLREENVQRAKRRIDRRSNGPEIRYRKCGRAELSVTGIFCVTLVINHRAARSLARFLMIARPASGARIRARHHPGPGISSTKYYQFDVNYPPVNQLPLRAPRPRNSREA